MTTTENKMNHAIDITNLSDACLDVLLAIANGDDMVLPEGLSNADLFAIRAELIRRGNDEARVGRWILDYGRGR